MDITDNAGCRHGSLRNSVTWGNTEVLIRKMETEKEGGKYIEGKKKGW